MVERELTPRQKEALSLAEVAFPFERMFQGMVVDGLPASGTFPTWIDVFERCDTEIRQRFASKGPMACYVIANQMAWFVGENIVSLTEILKEMHGPASGLAASNYLTVGEVYQQINPVSQTCSGNLCVAMADLARTRAFQSGEDVYGCKELEDIMKRFHPAMEHLNKGLAGVQAMDGKPTPGFEIRMTPEKQKLLHLWELLEIAIPRLKENDREPIEKIMKQLLRPGENESDTSESDQGFVFRVRNLLGKRLENRDRAFLSDTRGALLQSRREFLTINAFISTYHQMILAPRAYEEANAAVQYAILSKQRRYAARACKELADQSPQEMANLNQAVSKAAETEAKINPDRLLAELSQKGTITLPKDFVAETEEKLGAQQQEKVKKPRIGMHIRHK